MDIKLRADKWVTNNKDIKITDTDDGIKIDFNDEQCWKAFPPISFISLVNSIHVKFIQSQNILS